MPLGKSKKCNRVMASQNIREMRNSGHPPNVSIAAGLRSAGCGRPKRVGRRKG